jgi:hypothetical protein
MTTIEHLKSQLKICQDLDLTADAEKLQQQLAELETSNVCVEVQKGYSPDVRQPERITAAQAIQDAAAQEKELDEDIDEPSERKKIAVAPAIEDHQCAWTLAGCYLWLTSKNMSERKGVMFTTPRPFQELANKNLLLSVPKEAFWTTWNRLHGCALENFLISRKRIKEYKQILKEIMCSTPHWWREKYLANSEISTMTEE